MERNVFGFIYRHSRKQQIFVLTLTLISFPFLYYSLELPKLIINEAIAGEDFPKALLGVSLEQVPYLFALCGIFLALVFINGGFKYYINVYRGQLGERMLRRLRYELYSRVLRFRLPRFKKTSSGEIIPMITGEVEPIGGFVGDAFALPAFQGGTLLVYLVFIFVQDPVLGAASIALYPLQGYLIPRLQKRVNQLGKERVRTVRRLSEKVGETVAGSPEIHAHGTANLHLAEVSDQLGTIFDIRYEIFRRKFFIKFLNNFLNQLTPFFFYSIGGYLVLQGSLSFGALVAVLAAYKDLSSPWRELLNYYQRVEDVRIKYAQVVEQFQPEDIMSTEQLTANERLEGPLPRELVLSNVGFAEDDGVAILEGLSCSLPTDRHIGVLGGNASGKDELMLLLGRLLVPTTGRIRLGELNYAELPESIIGERLTYVGPSSFMFTDTLRANLYYGLKHRPVRQVDYEGDDLEWRRKRIAEALASGNTDQDVRADWIDYAAAGVEGPHELQTKAVEILDDVDMVEDVYRLGLNGSIDPERYQETAEKVMRARVAVRERLAGDETLSGLVELFDAERYNTSATVAENLLFGTPVGPTFSPDNMAANEYVLTVLDRVALTDDFLRMGVSVAETMIELFADLPPGHEFFEQFSFISSDELPEFQPLVTRARKEGAEALKGEDRSRVMSLPFKLIVSRHRLGLVDGPMQERLVEARRLFASDLPEALRPAVEFFDAQRYNAAASIQDNILFGKVRYGQAGVADQVQELITGMVDQMALRDPIIAVGLDHSVGVAGSRLSAAQRQKLGLARALLKGPELLVMNGATGTLDGVSQARVTEAVRRRQAGKGLIWSPHRPSLARPLDEVLVLKGGRLVARGRFDELAAHEEALRELIHAE